MVAQVRRMPFGEDQGYSEASVDVCFVDRLLYDMRWSWYGGAIASRRNYIVQGQNTTIIYSATHH